MYIKQANFNCNNKIFILTSKKFTKIRVHLLFLFSLFLSLFYFNVCCCCWNFFFLEVFTFYNWMAHIDSMLNINKQTILIINCAINNFGSTTWFSLFFCSFQLNSTNYKQTYKQEQEETKKLKPIISCSFVFCFTFLLEKLSNINNNKN